MSHNDLSHALTELKKEEGTAWLQEVSSVPLQQSLRHLDKAMVNFFQGRAKYLQYHKKHRKQSATYAVTAFSCNGSTLTLAKQKDPLDIIWSRPLPERCKPSSVTVTKDAAGRYFVSILVEEQIAALPMTDKSIGIDLGLKSFLITSEGETIDNPKYYVKAEKKRIWLTFGDVASYPCIERSFYRNKNTFVEGSYEDGSKASACYPRGIRSHGDRND